MIVLDTHAWLWWRNESVHLSARAKRAIAKADRIGVCAISCWEFAMLVAKGRISVDRPPLDWLRQALAVPSVELLPLTPAVAVKSMQLEGFHGDPADRLIVATALLEGVSLVTVDDRIRGYPGVVATW